jgi:hypothetical protein
MQRVRALTATRPMDLSPALRRIHLEESRRRLTRMCMYQRGPADREGNRVLCIRVLRDSFQLVVVVCVCVSLSFFLFVCVCESY